MYYTKYKKLKIHTIGGKNNHRHTECTYEEYVGYMLHYSIHSLKIYFPTCIPFCGFPDSTVDMNSRQY